MAGLLDSLAELNRMATNAAMPSVMSLLPANARMLAKSVVMPTGVTAADFRPDELAALRQAYVNSQERANSPDAQKYREGLKELESMDQGDMVFSGFDNHKAVPVEAEREQLIRHLSPTIQYPDYPISKQYDKYGIGDMPVSASFTDPAYAMSTTVGRAKYTTDPQGNVHVIDTYDFPRGQAMGDYKNWSMPFQLAHGFGEKYSNTMPVDINLGNIDKILKQKKAK